MKNSMLVLHRPIWTPWFPAWIAVVAGFSCDGAPPIPGLPPVEEVQEAAFREVLAASGRTSVRAYCLFVATDSGPADPVFDVRAQFANWVPPVLPGSACGSRGGPSRDSDGDTISVHLNSVDRTSSGLTVRVNYWWGRGAAVGYVCSVEHRQSTWTTTCLADWIS